MKLRKALEKNSANRGQWRIEPLSKPGLTAGQRVQEEEGVRFQVKSANDLFEKREQQQRDKNKKKTRDHLCKNSGNKIGEIFWKKILQKNVLNFVSISSLFQITAYLCIPTTHAVTHFTVLSGARNYAKIINNL